MNTQPASEYVYNAMIVNVVDGDTVDAVIDLGFMVSATHRLRLADVNCPEVHGPSRDAGLSASQFTREHLAGRSVVLESRKSDDFGRWLARIWMDGVCFNDLLVLSGHAVPYRVGGSGI